MQEAELVYRQLDTQQAHEAYAIDKLLNGYEHSGFAGVEYIPQIAVHAVDTHLQYSTSLTTLPTTVVGAIIGYEYQNDMRLMPIEKKIIHRYAQHIFMSEPLKAN